MKIGSLFSGIGGIELALEAAGHEVAWQVELDPWASRVLAEHWPRVPNYGDITTVDWAAVEPIDILCGGFPCQDISYAGRGAGIAEGTRSGLWSEFANAIGLLRPRFAFIENVAALVCRRPGFDVVLADLAALGFDAEWCCLRASDIGAPHQRERVFILASNTERIPRGERWSSIPRETSSGRTSAESQRRGGVSADTDSHSVRKQPESISGSGRSSVSGWSGEVASDTASNGRNQGRTKSTGLERRPDVALGGGSVASDGDDSTIDGERTRQEPRQRDPAVAYADGVRELQPEGTVERVGRRTGDSMQEVDWGEYFRAIAQWSAVNGPPPLPTNDRGQLAPDFVEWMMGFPHGWTALERLPKAQRLKMLGNAVVPQQGLRAWQLLIAGPRVLPMAVDRSNARPHGPDPRKMK